MDYVQNIYFTLVSFLSWHVSTRECLPSKLVFFLAHSLGVNIISRQFLAAILACNLPLRCLYFVSVTCVSLPFERKTSQCVRLFVSLWACLCMHVCVIIMSWSEAIWVGWLICIFGVNRYKYSWPGSKLVWIFILPPGRRRVERLWFQSAEQKLPSFCVVDENTWWLPWAPWYAWWAPYVCGLLHLL